MGHNVSGSFFEQVVDAIKADYDADDIAPDIDNERWKVGKLEGMGQTQSPSVRWRRPGGTIEPTEHAGPHEFTDASGAVLYFSSVYQELITVTAKISAPDWTQLGCILTGVLSATRDVMGKNATPNSYVHITEGDDDPEPSAQKGVQELLMTWEWKMLIPQAVGTLTEITSIVGANRLIEINADPGTAGPTNTQPLT